MNEGLKSVLNDKLLAGLARGYLSWQQLIFSVRVCHCRDWEQCEFWKKT